MVNNRTEEIRKHKNSIKSKLMASIAMLLISTIMLSSTTYAWFILSTAPEVKGMSTTVGANGSLEIALLNDSTDTTTIQSDVGDSSAAAGQTVAGSNITWGNIVDLSSDTYGLHGVTLYPSALNLNAAKTGLVSGNNALMFPTYGVDGRVAALSDETYAGKYVDGAFRADTSYFGVRTVGQADEADPLAFAFSNALNLFDSNINLAKSAAKASMDNYGTELVDIAMKHALDTNNTATFTPDEIANINNAAAGLQQAADYLKAAIQYAYQAYYVSIETELLTGSVTDVTMDTISAANAGFAAYVEAYETLLEDIADVTVADKDSYVWADIEAPLNALVDTNGMTIAGYTINEVRNVLGTGSTATDEEKTEVTSALSNAPVIVVKSGLYSDVANFVDAYTSDPFSLTVTYMGVSVPVQNATINAQKAATVTIAYGTAVDAALEQLTPPTGEKDTILTNYYGYIIDLAFRSSTTTDLLLSDAVQRVGDDDATMGQGSTFTLSSGSIADLEALRIVFIKNDPANSDFTILGVAAPEQAPTAEGGSVYKLSMQNWSVNADGGLQVNGPKTSPVLDGEDNPTYVMGEGEDTVDEDGYKLDDAGNRIPVTEADNFILALTADEAVCISVMVYLDGNFVESTLDGTTGTLNLQFGSSVQLTPMDYSGYVTSTDS